MFTPGFVLCKCRVFVFWRSSNTEQGLMNTTNRVVSLTLLFRKGSFCPLFLPLIDSQWPSPALIACLTLYSSMEPQKAQARHSLPFRHHLGGLLKIPEGRGLQGTSIAVARVGTASILWDTMSDPKPLPRVYSNALVRVAPSILKISST